MSRGQTAGLVVFYFCFSEKISGQAFFLIPTAVLLHSFSKAKPDGQEGEKMKIIKYDSFQNTF